jgi:hypothetical protein
MLVATPNYVYEIAENLLCQQCLHDSQPFRIERLPADGLACPVVPVGCVALITFLAVQIGMYPRTLDAFVLLSGFVRSLPVAIAVPPQPGKCVSGWRLGRGQRLAKFVQGLWSYLLEICGHKR